MIVCQCSGARERDIRHLVRRGEADLLEIGRLSGAGAGCGGCHRTLCEIVAREQRRLAAEPGAAADAPGLTAAG